MSQVNDLADTPDVMQVCTSGHVITDLLHGCPERGLAHCDRCGAPTIDHCQTCGQMIPGAVHVPGLVPAGSPSPPNYCATCGAAFPWTKQPRGAADDRRAWLERLLRRLPRMIAELRSRHGNRPRFCVEDEHDLEDLLRALLPLHFDDVRQECRTPRYAPSTRTDFLLAREGIALTAKLARQDSRDAPLADQLVEDAAYYRGRENCRAIIGFVYDPEGLLREPHSLERAWSVYEDLEVQCIIAGY
jgi:hypothetical protein